MQRPSLSPEQSPSIFFDHAAGSPLRGDVAQAMAEALVGLPPNPSGAHRLARRTQGVLEDARESIANALAVDPREVVITGGGTESCNLGIFGVPSPTAICISAVEHVAVREAAVAAGAALGVEVIELAVDRDGVIDVHKAVTVIPDGALVSVMAANNETGAIQPIAALRKALRHAPRTVIMHCDAVAASPTMALDEIIASCDLISLAGHKLGGPPSCGILIVKSGTPFRPRALGGGQELERRAGTQDVAGVVGMAQAISDVHFEIETGAVESLRKRRDRLQALILDAHPTVRVHSQRVDRLAGHLHMSVPGVVSEDLLMLFDQQGLCASAGAACASGAPRASHVLIAMGVSEDDARGAFRLTLALSNSDEEVDRAGEVVIRSISRLKASQE